MVSVGGTALDFTAPLTDIDGDIESFALSEDLDNAPIVLAFSPVAFTGTYIIEMCVFRDQMVNFEDVGATVYSTSIDTSFTLMEFAEQNGLDLGLINDTNRGFINVYDVTVDLVGLNVNHVTKRAVFVMDGDDGVTYAQVSDDPGVEPDYEAIGAITGKLETPSGAAWSRSTA